MQACSGSCGEFKNEWEKLKLKKWLQKSHVDGRKHGFVMASKLPFLWVWKVCITGRAFYLQEAY